MQFIINVLEIIVHFKRYNPEDGKNKISYSTMPLLKMHACHNLILFSFLGNFKILASYQQQSIFQSSTPGKLDQLPKAYY